MEPLPSHRSTRPEDLRRLFTRDHEQLDRLFRDLLAAFEADARLEAAQLWYVFEADLRAHMQLEEELLLPRFAEKHASEALALFREHDEIREKLLQLGVGVDLHATRYSQVEELVRMLRAHARREDELLYRWTDSHVTRNAERRGILERLATRFRHHSANDARASRVELEEGQASGPAE